MSKQILFFGSRSDLLNAVGAVERSKSVAYVLCTMKDQPTYSKLHSLSEIPNLGRTHSSSYITGDAYLVLEAGVEPRVREVKQDKGDVKFTIDQKLNQASIALRPGGIFEEGILICGNLGTASTDPVSRELYRSYSSKMVKAFKKVKAYYVGPEALQWLRRGWRLITIHAKEDPRYDLVE